MYEPSFQIVAAITQLHHGLLRPIHETQEDWRQAKSGQLGSRRATMRRLVIGLVAGALFGTFGVSVAGHDPAEQISVLRMQVSTLEMQVSSLGSQVSSL